MTQHFVGSRIYETTIRRFEQGRQWIEVGKVREKGDADPARDTSTAVNLELSEEGGEGWGGIGNI